MSVSGRRVGAIFRKELREYRRNGFIVSTMAVIPLVFVVFPLVEVLALPASSASALLNGDPLAFLLGITWSLSAMGAFTRDTAYLMMTIAPVLMFATPVFYSHETLSATWRLLMYANIMTGFIEIIRDIVVFGQLPNILVVAWTVFLSALTFWVGYWFFRRQQDGITDVI